MTWLVRPAIIVALAILLAGCADRIGLISPSSMVGSAGSLERRLAGEQVREVYAPGGYSLEPSSRSESYRLTQAGGLSWTHAREAEDFSAEIARLAEQIVFTLTESGLSGEQMIVVPTTFVNIDDLYQTSTFGRVATEQLAAELKTRGFEIVETRRSRDLIIKRRGGELGLSRESEEIFEAYQANALLMGTYTITAQQVLLNVRLVRAVGNTAAAVGTALFDRRSNLFLNSLLLRESSVGSRQKGGGLVKVMVSDQFVSHRLIEETIVDEAIEQTAVPAESGP